MLLEGLTVALRPRSPWEAADLGFALVRRHAARIWSAWTIITLPVCMLLCALGILIDMPWVGALLVWWLKPVFDRIPLFVLSRAVFGATPSLRETLHAQWSWGWRGALRWLHWRRFHPGRALLLPVDLLEGLQGRQRSERCRVLARANVSPSVLLTVIGANVEAMLGFSVIALALMFVPVEFMTDSAKAVWETLFESPPVWAQLLLGVIQWLAMSIMEPFYIGAGFGLYLNRRTQLEAWDIELGFRRLAARLLQSAAMLLFGAVMILAASPVRAQTPQADTSNVENPKSVSAQTAPPAPVTHSLQKIFSRQYRARDEDFERAVAKAFEDPDLSGKQTIRSWRPRHNDTPEQSEPMPTWLKVFAAIIAFLAENGLWVLLAIAIVLLVRYHASWLPWISDRFVVERSVDAVALHDIARPERLPDDVPAAVRALWQAGQPRAALALLYRAAVQRLVDALGAPLPPGATEAECLRQSRRLQHDSYAVLFARIVRSWQAIAYAQRVPTPQEFEALLADWQRRPEPTP